LGIPVSWYGQVSYTIGWVDVGTRAKVRWLYVAYIKDKENRFFCYQMTFIGEVTMFWVRHHGTGTVRVENLFFTL
jgi:hypothetical protein